MGCRYVEDQSSGEQSGQSRDQNGLELKLPFIVCKQDFESITEKAEAIDLETPLLSHGWSAAYSFSKCHLEESVPYDPFSHYAMPVEQFVRYARMWTRG